MKEATQNGIDQKEQLSSLSSMLHQCYVNLPDDQKDRLFDCFSEDEQKELVCLLNRSLQKTEQSDNAGCNKPGMRHFKNSDFFPTVDDMLMSAYESNHLDSFGNLLDSADLETRKSFLKIACYQQRDDFVRLLLDNLPADFNADKMAEQMVKEDRLSSLCYVLDYIGEDKKWELFDTACNLGHQEIADCLYDQLTGIKVKKEVLVKKIYDDCASSVLQFVNQFFNDGYGLSYR
jgi:hypothetical protein